MEKFKVILTNLSTKKDFHIQLKYVPVSQTEIEFKFGNSSKSLERNTLIFKDEDQKIVEPVKVVMISPKKYEKQSITISERNPFVYDVKAEIVTVSNKIFLNLASVEYILEKDSRYFIELNYLDQKSNQLELHF